MSIKTTSLSEILNDTHDHDTHDHPAPRIFLFFAAPLLFFQQSFKKFGKIVVSLQHENPGNPESPENPDNPHSL